MILRTMGRVVLGAAALWCVGPGSLRSQEAADPADPGIVETRHRIAAGGPGPRVDRASRLAFMRDGIALLRRVARP